MFTFNSHQDWSAGRALLSLIFLVCLSAAGFGQQYGRATSALIADVNQADDCTPEYQAFNDRIMAFGRIAASTKAFEEILESLIAANYRECTNDPFYGESIRVQTQKALSAARNMNGLHIKCTGGSGNASTQLGDYGEKVSDEFFSWGSWFGAVHAQLSRPVCRTGQSPGADNCRFAAYPWPYSQAAGIVWHEVMHQQGYTHGANNQADADDACGYPADPTWHFQRNTMPYIVGNAIDEVINRSAQRCDIDACASGNQLNIITSANSTRCECVNDPGQKGLALMQFEGSKLVDKTIKPHGDWIGGWHLGPSNKIVAQGDFNGDQIEDFVIKSSWGLGVFSHNGDYFTALMVKPNGTRFGGWNYQSRDNRIVGVGDFDRDGKDDLVITSGWGIGILTLRGNTMTSLVVKPNGTRFGGWNFNSRQNTIRAIDDFTGDGAADLLVTSGWGIGVLKLQGSSLTGAVVKPNGTRFGGWNYQTRDNRIPAIGDFNGDGKADIVVASGWGLGILTVNGASLSALMVKPAGTRFGGWNYAANNKIRQAGDFDGDGKDELIVTSGWGIGMLKLNGSTLTAPVVKPNGTRFGGWNYQSSGTTFAVAGDVNGDRRDDLIISSNWGVGILSHRSSSFVALDMKPFNGLFGSWPLQRTDDFRRVGKFSRNSRGNLIFMAGR